MSTVKLHTLARIPQDYDRRAKLAERRCDALVWLGVRKSDKMYSMLGGPAGFTEALRKADAEYEEYSKLADGA